ncbi:hypothetical protein RUND412_008760 [Rhizina undulata]
MTDPFSISVGAFGVVGLVPVLMNGCSMGYQMLKTARSVGEDWGELDYRREVVEARFNNWMTKMQLQQGDLLGLDSKNYAVVVKTLARIMISFRKIAEYMSTYEPNLPTHSESSTSGSVGNKNSKKSRLRKLKFWSKSKGLSEATSEHLEKMLDTLPQLPQAELQHVVDQFEKTARDFQQATSIWSQARWTLSGKEWLNQAFNDLEAYNENLFKITESVIQAGDIFDTLCQILQPRELGEPLANTPGIAVDVRTNFGRKSAVLHGMGGVGKSQIALEYAHRYRQCYTSVFWIDANDASRITESAYKIVEQLVEHYASKWRSSPNFQEISNILGIPGSIDASGTLIQSATGVAMKVVHKWLSGNENRGWLLLVDNNDQQKLGDLDKLIPTCDWGSVVITTRLPNLSRFGECVRIEEIGKEAGLELLLKSSGKMQKNPDDSELREAREIVKMLGELPLALDQAGAYISSLETLFSAYRNKLRQGLKVVFDTELDDPSLPSHKASVLTTWELSYQELPEDARQLLELCAFLGNEDIPEELFRRGKSGVSWILADENRFDDAMKSLFKFSFAKRKDSASFWIHPLVHSWVRENMESTLWIQTAENALTLVASTIVKSRNERRSDNWIFERRILSHLKVCQENIAKYFSGSSSIKVAEAASAIGIAYEELGYYEQAEELCQSAVAGYEKALGSDDPLIMDAVHDMALVLFKQKRYNEALQWYHRVLAGKTRVYGMDHPSTLDTIHYMALVFDDQGRHEYALEWYQRALAGKEKAHGKDHPSTLKTVNNMACIFDDQGRFEEALDFYKRALSGYEKGLGKDHPSTLDTVNNIALVFYHQGRYEEALELYNRALSGYEKGLGKDHPSTLDTVNNIALVFYHQGRYEEALELYNRALAGKEKALGKDHSITLDTVENMAIALHKLGRQEEVRKLEERFEKFVW